MYVTIAAMMNGQYHVVETDHTNYLIMIFCPFDTSKSKYVIYDSLKYITNDLH